MKLYKGLKHCILISTEIILVGILMLLLIDLTIVGNVKVDNRLEHLTNISEIPIVESYTSNKAKFVGDYRRLKLHNAPCIYDNIDRVLDLEIHYPKQA